MCDKQTILSKSIPLVQSCRGRKFVAHRVVQLPGVSQAVQNKIQAACHDAALLRLCGVHAFQVLHEARALRAVPCCRLPLQASALVLVLSRLGVCWASLHQQRQKCMLLSCSVSLAALGHLLSLSKCRATGMLH